MRRFLLPPDFGGMGDFELSGKDAHYLRRVLRLRPGDSFDAVDASGGAWLLTFRGAEGETVRLSALPSGSPSAPAGPASAFGRPLPEISLFLCLTKGGKLDQVVRQATEAGVRRIVPLESENAVRREKGDSAASRADRLSRVVREARQQSGSLVDTAVLPTIPLSEAPAFWGSAGPAFYFHEVPLAETSLHRYLDPVPDAVALLVGPEGGLSPGETSLLSAAGWIPIHLGPAVLRAETAAIYAVAAVQTILWERGSWIPKPISPQSE